MCDVVCEFGSYELLWLPDEFIGCFECRLLHVCCVVVVEVTACFLIQSLMIIDDQSGLSKRILKKVNHYVCAIYAADFLSVFCLHVLFVVRRRCF